MIFNLAERNIINQAIMDMGVMMRIGSSRM